MDSLKKILSEYYDLNNKIMNDSRQADSEKKLAMKKLSQQGKYILDLLGIKETV
jgi:hypothetical protein